jgi:phenylpropionate dioxygenase-like ring-hydroxylating dioxygenase large terminal subunit
MDLARWWILLSITLGVTIISSIAFSLPHVSFSVRLGTRASAMMQAWDKSWIPIAVLDDVDRNEIHSRQVLGKDLIFYRTGKGNSTIWTVTEDRCPHRAAPMNEGYIDRSTNDIVCRYHGWRFSANGSCTTIPQSPVAAPAYSSKACLKTYLTKEVSGVLWMWPNEDHEFSHITPIPGEEETSNGMTIALMQENMIDYPMMVENSFDPTHALFTHDGVSGFKSSSAIPMKHFSVIGNISETGFTVEHSPYTKAEGNVTTKRAFIAPFTNLVQYEQGPLQSVMLSFIPIKPGYTRVIGTIKTNAGKMNAFIKPMLGLLNSFVPQWLQRGIAHSVAGYTIVEQDLVIQHQQQLHMQRDSAKGVKWQQSYFLPTKADVGVSIFRRWLDTYSGGKIGWLEPTVEKDWIPRLDDEQLLNRWSRHTQHCNSCQKTAKLLRNRVQPALTTLLFVITCTFFRDLLMKGFQIKSTLPKIVSVLFTLFVKMKVQEMYKGYFVGKMPYRKNSLPPHF